MINQYRMDFSAKQTILTWKLVAQDKADGMINFFHSPLATFCKG